jgi:uncharacterized protein (TIGR04141 family)
VVDTKIGLTIYLLKHDKVAAFEEELKPGRDVRPLAPPLDGEFIPLPSAIGEPAWVGVIRGALQNSVGLALSSQSPAGLLVIRRPPNTFVISFGHAWQKLENHWLQIDFGLRVALNSIARDKLIGVRAEQVFAKWHIASERAPRASFVEEFGVEFDRDLVGSLEGLSSHKILGKTVRGGTSLRLQIPFSKLGPVLDKAGALFQSTHYKKGWPEVGNVSPIADPSLIARLEAELDAELASGQAVKKVVLFTPAERRDGESQLAESYVYGRMSRNPATRPFLRIEGWLTHLEEDGRVPSVQAAKDTRIHLLDHEKEAFTNYSVFDCFGYELTYGGTPYVLSSGTWHQVVPDFLGRVNHYVDRIAKPTVQLPTWSGAESEEAFNTKCGNVHGFLHFDSADVIFGGGRSRFEFCDFLHQKSKTLFFAKVGAKSSGMSHLVEQVRRTAELLFNVDGAYRAELAKVFNKYHSKVDASWLKVRPNNADWSLCMISLGRPAKTLPFFAKCALYRLHKGLTERGHKVYFGSV